MSEYMIPEQTVWSLLTTLCGGEEQTEELTKRLEADSEQREPRELRRLANDVQAMMSC